MGKRRTRKQKQKAHHEFTIHWEPSSLKPKIEAGVNRQIVDQTPPASPEASLHKKPQNSAKELDLTGIKKNIRMSLIYTGLILISEIVLYFIWH